MRKGSAQDVVVKVKQTPEAEWVVKVKQTPEAWHAVVLHDEIEALLAMIQVMEHDAGITEGMALYALAIRPFEEGSEWAIVAGSVDIGEGDRPGEVIDHGGIQGGPEVGPDASRASGSVS